MPLNRIYQGRVAKVEIQNPDAAQRAENPWVPLVEWEKKLWNHHVLFQDAVNYYIAAIASLGSSPESPLTKLRGRLADVWNSVDKKGQTRAGMGESLKRAFQLQAVPTLDEVVELFRRPLREAGVVDLAAELAGESLLHDLGGDGAIQQGGRQYFPMFYQSKFLRGVTFPRQGSKRTKDRMQEELPEKLWAVGTEAGALALQEELEPGHFVNVSSGTCDDVRVKNAFAEAVKNLPLADAQRDSFTKKLETTLPDLPNYAGGSVSKDALKNRFYAFLAFKYLCAGSDPDTGLLAGVEILKRFYKEPKTAKTGTTPKEKTEEAIIEERLCSLGDDPVKQVRDKAQIVFRAFMALPRWSAALDEDKHSVFADETPAAGLHPIAWSEFDIAAFKEALKVCNQFNQNVVKREEKLDRFALKLLVMDGEKAITGYDGQGELDKGIRARLQRLWDASKGKPKIAAGEGEAGSAAWRPHLRDCEGCRQAGWQTARADAGG